VPEGHVFERGEHVRTHEAREAANLFAGDRIALVRHGGTAALLAAERLFGFADFGALEMPNFERDLFERGGDEREGAEIVRVAVALNYLRGDGHNAEPKAFADSLFHFRAEMRGVPDGAGNFSDSHLRGGFAEARDVALIFREPVGDFQAKRDGLGVHAVSAADLRRVAKFVSAQIENFSEHHQVALD